MFFDGEYIPHHKFSEDFFVKPVKMKMVDVKPRKINLSSLDKYLTTYSHCKCPLRKYDSKVECMHIRFVKNNK
jgi:hypothetical protein